jgi:hypothetical protein
MCSCTINHLLRRFTQMAVCRQSIFIVSSVFRVNERRNVKVIQATSPRRVTLRSLLGISLPPDILSKKNFWTPFLYSTQPLYCRKNPRCLKRLYRESDAEDKNKSRRSQGQPPGRERAINLEA